MTLERGGTPTSKKVTFGLGAAIVALTLLIVVFGGSEEREPAGPANLPRGGAALRAPSWGGPATTAGDGEHTADPVDERELARQAEAAARWRGLEIAYGRR